MKTITLITTASLLLLTGCGMKMETPVELDETSPTTVNDGLLKKSVNKVPHDYYLEQKEWEAALEFTKGRYMIPSKKLIKTFYFAHNAHRITIIGKPNLTYKYKRYFRKNGVSALICRKNINIKDSKHITILFSHRSSDLRDLNCDHYHLRKRATPVNSPVIKI